MINSLQRHILNHVINDMIGVRLVKGKHRKGYNKGKRFVRIK